MVCHAKDLPEDSGNTQTYEQEHGSERMGKETEGRRTNKKCRVESLVNDTLCKGLKRPE